MVVLRLWRAIRGHLECFFLRTMFALSLGLFIHAVPFRDYRIPGIVFGRIMKGKLPPRPGEESTQFRMTDAWWEICLGSSTHSQRQ
ncbi:hypothetical protein EDD15DRAFT_2316638 [Pisolithus albus]|nr:hypothetical protein EDD15DRAFT_2316638 [Pisolithus albus]